MKINKLEFEESDKKWIYIGSYNTLFEKSELVSEIMSLLSEGVEEKEIVLLLKSKNYFEDEIREQLKIIDNCFQKCKIHKQNQFDKVYKVTQDDWDKGRLVSSLLINVSHDCNLRCVYCYGDGGSYGQKSQLMTREKAKIIIDYWMRHLNYNERISVIFFGGEPLINKEVIKYSIEYINRCLSERNTQACYSMTTNGTILDQEIIEFLKVNDFRIILSIDGDKKIHNRNRPYISGKGSYSVITRNIERLKENHIRMSARLTLTHENVKYLSKSVKDIWDLGIDKVSFDIVVSNNDCLSIKKADVECIEKQIEELAQITYDSIVNNKKKVFTPIINYGKSLHRKTFVQTCGYNSLRALMVDPEGEIFRCHRLLGNNEFKAGDVYKGLDWEKFTEDVNISCEDCWAESICNKCVQVNYSHNSDVHKPYDLWCAIRKKLMLESLKLYVKISMNEDKRLMSIY